MTLIPRTLSVEFFLYFIKEKSTDPFPTRHIQGSLLRVVINDGPTFLTEKSPWNYNNAEYLNH